MGPNNWTAANDRVPHRHAAGSLLLVHGVGRSQARSDSLAVGVHMVCAHHRMEVLVYGHD
jgi:hypothetical protein